VHKKALDFKLIITFSFSDAEVDQVISSLTVSALQKFIPELGAFIVLP
jgi:hypothetical protein